MNNEVRVGKVGRAAVGSLMTIITLAIFGLYGILWDVRSEVHATRVELEDMRSEVERLAVEVAIGGRVTSSEVVAMLDAMLNRTQIDFQERDRVELRRIRDDLLERETL